MTKNALLPFFVQSFQVLSPSVWHHPPAPLKPVFPPYREFIYSQDEMGMTSCCPAETGMSFYAVCLAFAQALANSSKLISLILLIECSGMSEATSS